MDARPTTEQRALEDAASRLGEKLGPATVGDLDDDDRRARLESAITQAGWRELRDGAPGAPLASGVEAALVARALAHHACDVSFVGPVLARDLARRCGDDQDVARTIAVSLDLGTLARGDGIAFDAAGSTRAVAAGAGEAVVELTLDGLEPGTGVDLTRSTTTISGPGTVIGEIRPDDLLAWEALAVTLTAADLVGVMEGALELATAYAGERRQFGAPIGSFQAVQHLLAEAKTLTEGARSAMTYAAWAVDALAPAEARAAAAVAKAYAARSARTVCETGIQVHGGIGNTWECMAHVFLRRALVSTELFGGDGPQLSLLAHQRWGAALGLP